jgi:flagellar basal body-associated protein FliL
MLERIASENALQSLETRSSQNSGVDTPLPNLSNVPPMGSYNGGISSPPMTQLSQPRRKRSFIGLLIAVIVLILLVNVGLGAWFLGKNASQQTASTQLTQTLSHSHPTSIVVPTPSPTQIVNIAPTSPPLTSTPAAIAYPSDAQAKDEISYYYTHGSDFTGKNVIQHFDSLTYGPFIGPASQPQFIACAQYQYASVSSPTVTLDTVRHTFTFQYANAGWSVIDIGNLNSC